MSTNVKWAFWVLIISIQLVISQDPCDPNPCQHNGICKGLDEEDYLCECLDPFYGKNCGHQRVRQLILGQADQIDLEEDTIAFYNLILPHHGPSYGEDTILLELKSTQTSCKYVYVEGSSVYFDSWEFDPVVNSSGKVELASSTFSQIVSYDSLLQQRVTLSIFALDGNCTVDLNATVMDKEENYCVNGYMEEGICHCRRYWAGSNCDQFSLKLVFVLASISGAFILATAITTFIIRCFFTPKESVTYDRIPQ